MGKLKSHIQDFLESGGDQLGYGWENTPELKDLSMILSNNIPVWEYNGYATEKDYYGG
jgi:hypothetical protein